MDKPNTTWKERCKKGGSLTERPVWAKCRKCGREDLVFSSCVGEEGYLCKSCNGREEGVVSIMCLRHKKRVNVPSSWLDVSKWLCPACFERLSPEKRGDYAPKGYGSSVREAEKGKPTVFPSKCGSKYADKGAIEKHIDGQEKTDVESVSKKRSNGRNVSKRDFGTHSLAIEGLLPRYRISCQKCGEVVRCHYTWFDNSTVLCPSCYSKMNAFEIQRFHEMHKASKPEFIPNPIPVETGCRKNAKGGTKDGDDWTRKSTLVNSGGYWSNSRIMSASERELREAADAGIVSKARMRIELNRRKNTGYFDLLPNDVGLSYSQIF